MALPITVPHSPVLTEAVLGVQFRHVGNLWRLLHLG